MEVVRFKDWKLRADSYHTQIAYQTIQGVTRSCDCRWCSNFVAVREDVYPRDVLALLDDLGVDHTKEADLYQQDRDPSLGKILYRWWFYFIGHIEEGRQAWEFKGRRPDKVLPVTYWDKHLETLREPPSYFGIGFSDDGRRREEERQFVPEQFEGFNLVQVEFNAYVPWMLGGGLPQL